MIDFSSKNYHFMTYNSKDINHLKAKYHLSTDPSIRKWMGDSIDYFLEAEPSQDITNSAFLVARENKIIGYLALFDYYKSLEMHYALISSARGYKYSLTETTGCSLLKEASSAIFEIVPSIEYLKLYIDRENINSINAAINSGFSFSEKQSATDEYRKYRSR